MLRVLFTNQLVILGHALGIPPSKLRRWYYAPAEQPVAMNKPEAEAKDS